MLFSSLDIRPDDPAFVGAWWIGFFPSNTKYFQNIFKMTEKNLLETFTINMNKTLAKCSITIGKTLVK